LPTFELGPKRIQYAVVKGTSRRYTYFRFRNDLTLEVVLPRGRRVDVERVIAERSGWLRREYDRMSRTRNVLDRDLVMYDGRLLRIVFSHDRGDSIAPDPSGGTVTFHTSDAGRIRELVRRWFLAESSAYVVKKVAQLAPQLGVKPSRVDVREMGKWGYCTRGGRLSFSWQLIALPERLREYVVLHELTHLVHFDHSRGFKRRLAASCPDFRERERELDLIAPYDRLAPP
jgi:predicted metal-dependent hydrolase